MNLADWIALLVFWMKLGFGALVCLVMLFVLMVAIAALDRARNPWRLW